jgi:hypothetical protein
MIHIIHTLGGCGGTVLSRCIGVLPRVALFSEINPAAVKLFPTFDPLYQDRNWTHLLCSEELEQFSGMDLSQAEAFRALISILHERCIETGRRLVLRDYNFIDFVGVPFCAHPPQRLTLYSALPPGIPTTSVAFIRHPLDQWSSLCKHDIVRDALTPSRFCEAYSAFLRELQDIPRHKYEDFTAHPERILSVICSDLDLPFDSDFIVRFHAFGNVTGDFTRHQEQSISAPERRDLPAHVLDEFRQNGLYGQILAKTGYSED